MLESLFLQLCQLPNTLKTSLMRLLVILTNVGLGFFFNIGNVIKFRISVHVSELLIPNDQC